MDEFLFVGTGADDWERCENQDFYRRKSAALLNGEILIDCGEDVFDFAESINNKDLYKNVTDIIITHDHSDHFVKETIFKIAENKQIRLGGSKHLKTLLGDNPNIEYVDFKPGETKKMGDYQVTALLANHDMVIDGDACAFHYIIKTKEDKTIFYGLDGAWILRPTWERMKREKFDLMVFDCTVGDMKDWRLFEHNTIPMLQFITEGVKMAGMLSDGGKMVASHLAMTLHKSHEETEEILNKINVLTAYDGMKIIL